MIFDFDYDEFKRIHQDYVISKEERLLRYGTAGFRTKAHNLRGISFRVGVITAFYAIHKRGCCGIMITASHNAPEDNGLKIIDTDSGMLDKNYESYYEAIIKSENLSDYLHSIREELLTSPILPITRVIVGNDTRNSSPMLKEACLAGLRLILKNEHVIEFGEVSTPQLHYFVHLLNTDVTPDIDFFLNYYTRHCNAMVSLLNAFGVPITTDSDKRKVYVDCAHGVGAKVLCEFNAYIRQNNIALPFDIVVINDITSESERNLLNTDCGADFIKINQSPSKVSTYDKESGKLTYTDALEFGPHVCSFDGDADRIIYLTRDSYRKSRVLDGDRLAILVLHFIMSCLGEAKKIFKIGYIHTAYTNRAAVQFVSEAFGTHVTIVCAKTGVKYLHQEAKKFDIGVYFEANGHGAVYFSEEAQNYKENKNFTSIVQLLNPCVGDSFSDLLLCETIFEILCVRHSFSERNEILSDLVLTRIINYREYQSILQVVPVPNKHVYETNECEDRLLKPLLLQRAIDKLTESFTDDDHYCRAFVRASGTEDVVRIYTEATTLDICEKLQEDLRVLLTDFS